MALRAIAARLPARARAMGHLASLDFDPLTVGQLTRVQLLELAKNHGQNTNMPSSEIVAALKRIYMMRSADQSFIDVRIRRAGRACACVGGRGACARADARREGGAVSPV